jgi:ribosomal protein S18 acetylase RimI-like enzyme
MEWAHGRHLLCQRLMGLRPPAFVPAPTASGLRLRAADTRDLEGVLRVDTAAFGSDAEAGRPWLAALLGAPDAVVTVACALAERQIVATGYTVLTDATAGPSAFLAAIAVLPEYRRRGFGSAVSSWLVRRGFEAGAKLAHLAPDDERAARLYGRLGFVETAGLDIYVDLAPGAGS